MECSCHSIALPFYQFPVATVINYHYMGGLKQQKLMLSLFQKPEVQTRDVSRATLRVTVPGEDLSLLLHPGVSWLLLHHFHLCLRLHMAFSLLCLFSRCLISIHVIGFRAHLDNPEQSRFEIFHLIISAKSFLPIKSHSEFQDVDISFEGPLFNPLYPLFDLKQ